jgi:hypothetical protein
MSETNKEKLMGTLQSFKNIFGCEPIRYTKTCTTNLGNIKKTSFLNTQNENDITREIQHDLESYDDDLRHKHQPKVQILSADFNEAEHGSSGISVMFN